jgi:hypothetical protein
MEETLRTLKTLALALLLVTFGASFAHAGPVTTVNIKFVNDSGKEMPVAINTTIEQMNFTLSAGQTLTLPIKNLAENESTTHPADIRFGGRLKFSSSNFGNPPPNPGEYTLHVTNQLINGEAELENVVIIKGDGHCTDPYKIVDWKSSECTVELTIVKCDN